jgi:hypothetical protein
MEWVAPTELRSPLAAPEAPICFIAFARTICGDYFCWDLNSTSNNDVPVVFCPHDGPIGYMYAPDFLGSAYRSVLQYAASFEGSTQEADDLHRTIEQLSAVLPSAWHQTLASLDPTTASGSAASGTLDREDTRALLGADLAFSRLDEEFNWFVERG